ncbi:MAG: AmmeMemoRadiSam system protein A [Candidatus Micrarchaeia archaeon]
MAIKLANRLDTPPETRGFRAMAGQVEPLESGLDFIEKRYLLAVARLAVGHYLASGSPPGFKLWETPSPRIAREKASFVTIYAHASLRGCIGSLQAHRPLIYDVLENAVSSAFHDERFPPLGEAELPHVRFSISILEELVPFRANAGADLLEGIEQGKHGLVIRKGASMATYLPHVWRAFPEKEDFLKNLCIKAGLHGDEWKEPRHMDFFTFEAQEFSE